MLKNTQINRAVTKKIALALGELNNSVVYVGGAVISLYIDDPAAEDVRPTKDLDLTLKIASLSELESLREKLTSKAFTQTFEESIICRFRYDDIFVDVMATQAIGWAPGNRWFERGFEKSINYQLDEIIIKLLPITYFIATKFDAFFDRGVKDIWISHDFEDIVYLLNYSSQLVEQMSQCEDDILVSYLAECARELLTNSIYKELIIGNLYHDNLDEQLALILRRLEQIASL
jgi:hypothetical protein